MSNYAITYLLTRKNHLRAWELPPADFGRILTIPEVNAVRRRHDAADEAPGNPWNVTYLTSSLEYYGVSPGGVGMTAVRHGDGPSQEDLDADPQAFARLLEGDYGEVYALESSLLSDWWHRGLNGHWSTESPLVEARLGGAEATVGITKQFRFQVRRKGVEGCQVRGRLPVASATVGRNRVERLVISSVIRYRDREHLIDTSGQTEVNACHAAMASDGPAHDIAPPIRLSDIVLDPARAGWVPDGIPRGGLVPLRRLTSGLMTDGLMTDMGEGWPGHRVERFLPMGGPMTFTKAEDIGSYLDAQAIAANCYVVLGDGERSVTVLPGFCSVDWSARVPSADELLYDWKTRGEVTRAHGERWWRKMTVSPKLPLAEARSIEV